MFDDGTRDLMRFANPAGPETNGRDEKDDDKLPGINI